MEILCIAAVTTVTMCIRQNAENLLVSHVSIITLKIWGRESYS